MASSASTGILCCRVSERFSASVAVPVAALALLIVLSRLGTRVPAWRAAKRGPSEPNLAVLELH